MRHGDRKPKQKLKFETSEPEILAYHPHQTVPSLSSPTPYRAQPSSAVAPASHNTTAGSDSAVPGGGTTAPRVPFPFKKKEVKLKSPEELQELLEKTRTILGRLVRYSLNSVCFQTYFLVLTVCFAARSKYCRSIST